MNRGLLNGRKSQSHLYATGFVHRASHSWTPCWIALPSGDRQPVFVTATSGGSRARSACGFPARAAFQAGNNLAGSGRFATGSPSQSVIWLRRSPSPASANGNSCSSASISRIALVTQAAAPGPRLLVARTVKRVPVVKRTSTLPKTPRRRASSLQPLAWASTRRLNSLTRWDWVLRGG